MLQGAVFSGYRDDPLTTEMGECDPFSRALRCSNFETFLVRQPLKAVYALMISSFDLPSKDHVSETNNMIVV